MQRGDRIVITGASSGLGAELARQLACRGCRLALTARRATKLARVAEAARSAGAESVLELVGSVADESDVERHCRSVIETWGGIDALILNAGVGDSDHSRNFSSANYRWHFETNFFGACTWLERVIPHMLERRCGMIVGVSSPAAWRGMPATGPYSASKAALSTMLESVRVDLRGTGVEVVIVCPGFVKSELTDRNDPAEMVMLLDTVEGVRRLLRGVDRRRRVVHFPFPFTHFVRYVIRPMPGWLFDRFAARYVRRSKAPYVDESGQKRSP